MVADGKIVKWNKIQKEFEGEMLFLGNGSSIALSAKFDYKKIREQAVKLKFIEEETCKIFEGMETEDFEKILEYLYHASKVNEFMGLDNKEIKKYYDNLRNGLIATVKDIHPSYPDLINDLKEIGAFLNQFKTVIDLNYDLIAYWGIMYNKENGNNLHDDFFRQNGEFKFEEVENILNKKNVIVYPHGNLVICKPLKSEKIEIESKEQKTLENQEFKIRGSRTHEDYISILTNIQKIDFLEPVFVSEGTKIQKEEMIRKSPYLKTIFLEVLPKVECSAITFLGFSFSENDEHIIEKLENKRELKVAVSVYNKDQGIIKRATRMLSALTKEIRFFDVETCGWPQHNYDNNLGDQI